MCFFCHPSMLLLQWQYGAIIQLKNKGYLQLQNQLKLKELVSYNDFKAILNDLDAVNANVFPVY